MKKIYVFLMAMILLLGLSVSGHATLVLRGTDTLGNQLIYDTDLDITWYDYTRYDTWQNQVNWTDAIYAGTRNAGVFKGIDGGSNWSAIGLSDEEILFLVVEFDNKTLFAGTYNHGVFALSLRNIQ